MGLHHQSCCIKSQFVKFFSDFIPFNSEWIPAKLLGKSPLLLIRSYSIRCCIWVNIPWNPGVECVPPCAPQRELQGLSWASSTALHAQLVVFSNKTWSPSPVGRWGEGRFLEFRWHWVGSILLRLEGNKNINDLGHCQRHNLATLGFPGRPFANFAYRWALPRSTSVHQRGAEACLGCTRGEAPSVRNRRCEKQKASIFGCTTSFQITPDLKLLNFTHTHTYIYIYIM